MPNEPQLYQIIGELFVARAVTERMYQELLKQVDDMAAEITKLRQELSHGKLAESYNNDPV